MRDNCLEEAYKQRGEQVCHGQGDGEGVLLRWQEKSQAAGTQKQPLAALKVMRGVIQSAGRIGEGYLPFALCVMADVSIHLKTT